MALRPPPATAQAAQSRPARTALYSLQRACKALCATGTAGSHEGRPSEPPRKHWLRAQAMLQPAVPSSCDHRRRRSTDVITSALEIVIALRLGLLLGPAAIAFV